MTANKKFLFDLRSSRTVMLDIADIWPNGDAPDDPTVQDVIDEISKGGHPPRVMDDLGLSDLLEIVVSEPGSQGWGTAVYGWGDR